MARLNYPKISPEGYAAFGAISEYISKCGLEMSLVHMVYLRASQINGCPYCVDLHWREATAAGVEARKLNAVIIFRDAPFFSEREKAALTWAEAVTKVENQRLMELAYNIVKSQFSEKEIVDLTFGIALINSFNRIAIGFHSLPKA